MIPKECRRLAEVDFPIAEVSRQAAREKAIRHGHPSSLHLWWARRPLASSRAVLLELLLPDPCDDRCPKDFKAKAAEVLLRIQGRVPRTDDDLKRALLKFVGEFANWDLATHPSYLEVGRELVKAAHGIEPPLVVDPFAGGGSIPLEALRLGCEAFASDLNPVASLILKVLLEDIPRRAPELAEQLSRVGTELKRAFSEQLVDLYPKDPDGAVPMAYLWARTVRCESPNCGAEIPLARSFWLCDKASRPRALRHRVIRAPNQPPRVVFEVFEPEAPDEVPRGTLKLSKATCIACGAVVAPDRVRAQLVPNHGGADVKFDAAGHRIGGAALLAVVTLDRRGGSRKYRVAAERDYRIVSDAQETLARILDGRDSAAEAQVTLVPDEPTPQDGTGSVGGGFRTRKYGLVTFGDFFTARQKVALLRLAHTVQRLSIEVTMGEIAEALGLALGKLIRHYNVISKWHRGSETVAGAFGMQAIPMSWDFPEMFPLVDYAGGLNDALEDVIEPIQHVGSAAREAGQCQLADAADHPLPDHSAAVWFTDPPYYDNVPYADLSDFFFVWLKRVLPGRPDLRDPFDPMNRLTPKNREAVRDEQVHLDGRPKKPTAWYEQTMLEAFREGRRVLRPDGIGSVVFAHKTTEGWEALLSGITRGGWTITGSWPVATERGARLRARESAALGTSVHLVCRPRPEDAQVGDWSVVLRELPGRVRTWMQRLQAERVRGADLVFACIGPALEIFSRYAKVETADGREVALPEYLEKVWEVVGRNALSQVLGTAEGGAGNGEVGALEEDARLTALFLWTLQSTSVHLPSPNHAYVEPAGEEPPEEDEDTDEDLEGVSRRAKGFTLVFDVVRRFAQPLGIDLPRWEGRIVETKKGVVRLLPVAERAKQLFGEDGARSVAEQLEHQASVGTSPLQELLFPELDDSPGLRSRGRISSRRSGTSDVDLDEGGDQQATTLDRVHAGMLFQAAGRANALRALVKAEQERGPDFLRLANALAALYPPGCEEKRLLEAMLVGAR